MSHKQVVLIDDVLFTGRTIRSALDAITDFGRPNRVELLVLIDRLYSRDLPIQADYVGLTVDTRAHDKVKVEWKEQGKKDIVQILPIQP
jgi:pyrimidine operon attenuation protein/uracil phosphoribosyltransferase